MKPALFVYLWSVYRLFGIINGTLVNILVFTILRTPEYLLRKCSGRMAQRPLGMLVLPDSPWKGLHSARALSFPYP